MGRRNVRKGRSITTYHNKIKKLKKFYRITFAHSVKQKEVHMALPEKQRPNKKYFCDKYTDEKSFLKVIKIKQASV